MFEPVVLTDEPGVAFLRRHPATREVVIEPTAAGSVRAALLFRDDAPRPPQEMWVMPNSDIPRDRAPDLLFPKAGQIPPLGFWMTHPEVLAWTTPWLENENADGYV